MSARLTGAAFYVILPPREKLLLLALCDSSNDAGENVHAGVSVLSIKVGVSGRTIQRSLVKLAELGLIRIEKGGAGPGDVNRATINRQALLAEAHKGDKLAPIRVTNGTPKRVTNGTPKRVTNGDHPAPVSSFIEAQLPEASKLPEASRSSKTTEALADADFIRKLEELPAYRGIDIEIELSRMDAWLMTPAGRRRHKTRRFIVNWLNRIDAAMPPQAEDKMRRVDLDLT